MPYRILLRRDNSAKWIQNDPVLMLGEPGYETDTGKLKIGDGQTPWSSLQYYGGGEFVNIKELYKLLSDKQDRLQNISGNIGVGILDVDATEKLDVNGNVKATGFKTPNGTANQVLTADGGVFDLNTINNYIEVTKTELDSLIASSQLSKSSLYKISGVNPTLYGGTTIFLTAIENNKLSTDGYGIFYNPKYDKSIDGFGIVKDYVFWKSVEEQTESGVYNIGDRVIWGGKHWNCISPTIVDTKYIIDKFNLDTAYFEEIPFNETDYNVVYDEIKYDYEHDLIIERIEQNSNIVSFNYESLNKLSNDNLEGDLTKDNFIKNFQWGNVFDYNLQKGIGNNNIKNSLSENINFSGSYQTNITVDNSYRSNLVFTNGSYQDNLVFSNSYQSNLVFTNGSYQSNITFTNDSYQSNLVFTDGSYQKNLLFTNNSKQENLVFVNNSYQDTLTFVNKGSQSTLTFDTGSYQKQLLFTNVSFQRNLTFTNNSYQRYLTFNTNSYQDNLNFDNGSYQFILLFSTGLQSNLYFTNSGYQLYVYIESSNQGYLNIDNGYQRTIKLTNDSYVSNTVLTNVHQENIVYNRIYISNGGNRIQNNQVNLVYDGVMYREDNYLGIGDKQSLSTFSIKSTGSLSTNKVLKISNNSKDLLTLNGTGGLGLGVENLSSSKLVIKSEVDTYSLSNELLTSTGWTSTGWTGDFTTGFTHTVGNTSILSHTLGGSVAYVYRIEIIILNRTAGSINISFGGIIKTSITSTQTIAQNGLNTSKLQITPTSDFDGTVKISIKRDSTPLYPATILLMNSSGVKVGEIRASLYDSNSFFGNSSGGSNMDGTANSFFGSNSGIKNLSGKNNSFFGYQSGSRNVEGSYNSYFGSDSGSNNIGNENSFFGYQSGLKISNGSDLKNSNSSLFIGYDTRANADNETNQIVIGHTARGDGSNSVVLGNSSITRTRLQGQVIMGSFTSAPTGIEGAIYYNSTDKKHYGFNGTTWNALY